MTETNTETEQQPAPAPVPDYASEGIPTETRPMMPANPVNAPDPDDEIFGSGREGITEAAEKLTERRNPDKREWQAKTPLPVEYLDVQSGAHKSAAETISAEQGAHDLTNFRRTLAEQELSAAERAAVEQLDADAMLAEIQQAVDKPPPSEVPQSEAPAQEQQVDPNADLVAELQRSPRLMAALEQQQQQYAAAVEAEKAAYIQGLAQNAATALYAATVSYPELRSVTHVNQIPLVINTVAASNPDRAKQMSEFLGQVGQLHQQAQTAAVQHQQQQAAAWHQSFQKAAEVEDKKFYDWALTQDSPERIKQVSEFAKQMLLEEVPKEELALKWDTDGTLRSAFSQKALYEMAKARMAREGIRQKMTNPVPIVQRPGSPAARGSEEEYNTRQLSDRLSRSTGRQALQAAAELVVARRARR